jgi:hypothetical protein
VFVNYRRDDSAGEAGRLFDELTLRFGPEAVFMDVVAIEPGRDFRKAIDQSVATCNVLLALIGHDWLELKDSVGTRRLDDANDFVRLELASALRRDIPVIPVLVRGGRMPRAEQLPDDLKDLAYRNAVELTHARWKSDVEVLLRALRVHMEVRVLDTPVFQVAQVEKRPTEPLGSISGTQRAAGRVDVDLKIDAHTMERVSRRLAEYIGPIAEVVVKRAARQCSSAEELYGMAAREIGSEADRAKFLRTCRSG